MKGNCPECGQRIPPSRPVRICFACKKQIKRDHKWVFVTSDRYGTRVRHRVCEEPDAYQRTR